jgi:hypothetical protein
MINNPAFISTVIWQIMIHIQLTMQQNLLITLHVSALMGHLQVFPLIHYQLTELQRGLHTFIKFVAWTVGCVSLLVILMKQDANNKNDVIWLSIMSIFITSKVQVPAAEYTRMQAIKSSFTLHALWLRLFLPP